MSVNQAAGHWLKPRLLLQVFVVVAVLVGAVVVADARRHESADSVMIPEHVRDAVSLGEPVEIVVTGDGDVGGERFGSFDASTVMVSSTEELDALAKQDGVRALGLGSEQAVRYVADSVQIVGAQGAYARGFRGTGSTVVVIDGGVQNTHIDLADAVTHEACFIQDPSDGVGYCPGGLTEAFGPDSAPDDSFSHGTMLAGIIAGAGNLAPEGVASGAELEIIKIFEEDKGGYLSDLLRALDYLAVNRTDIDVVNLSFGYAALFGGECDSAYTALYDAVEVLRAQGVTVVAASGNLGLATMGAPACLSNVLSVATAHDEALDLNFLEVAALSNVSSATDIAAPAMLVETTATTPGGVSVIQGTSPAAAIVSGCAALTVEAGVQLPAVVQQRLKISDTIAPNPNGPSLPLVDCDIDFAPTGDVTCDGLLTADDPQAMLEYVVGLRTPETCPLSGPGGISLEEGDLDFSGTVDMTDVVGASRCVANLPAGLC